MNELPMPSDLRCATGTPSNAPASASTPTLVEPPGVKLIVRLFLIPLLIVAAAVGVMYLISLLAGRAPTVEEAIARLKNPGGARTADYLVGPGAKQRYLDAKVLTDHMKERMSSGAFNAGERVKINNELITILDNHTKADEGEVQHFLLLALGRVWQVDPKHPLSDTPESLAARSRAADTLLKYASAPQLATRKAAVLASVYLRGNDDVVGRLVPALVAKLRDTREDLDVRLAAATSLGPLASPDDADAIDALHEAMNDSEPRHVELVWQSALSLAQLNQPDVADTILKLLSRAELASLQYYDRETDPKNPVFRKLSDAEQERILINTMIGAERYDVPAVQEQLRKLATTDPSPRVRAALQGASPRHAVSESP
jgi:hypothetical protein